MWQRFFAQDLCPVGVDSVGLVSRRPACPRRVGAANDRATINDSPRCDRATNDFSADDSAIDDAAVDDTTIDDSTVQVRVVNDSAIAFDATSRFQSAG